METSSNKKRQLLSAAREHSYFIPNPKRVTKEWCESVIAKGVDSLLVHESRIPKVTPPSTWAHCELGVYQCLADEERLNKEACKQLLCKLPVTNTVDYPWLANMLSFYSAGIYKRIQSTFNSSLMRARSYVFTNDFGRKETVPVALLLKRKHKMTDTDYQFVIKERQEFEPVFYGDECAPLKDQSNFTRPPPNDQNDNEEHKSCTPFLILRAKQTCFFYCKDFEETQNVDDLRGDANTAYRAVTIISQYSILLPFYTMHQLTNGDRLSEKPPLEFIGDLIYMGSPQIKRDVKDLIDAYIDQRKERKKDPMKKRIAKLKAKNIKSQALLARINLPRAQPRPRPEEADEVNAKAAQDQEMAPAERN